MKASSYGLTVGGVDGHGDLVEFGRNGALGLGGVRLDGRMAFGRRSDVAAASHAMQEERAVVMGVECGSDSQRCVSLYCEQIVRAGL